MAGVFSDTRSSMTFGLVTDSHYAEREPAGTRYYRQSLEKMEEFIEVMNASNVDFIIHLGDFKDEAPEKKESDTLRFLEKIESVFAGFKGPRYHCVGNHDVDSITKEQFLALTENTGIAPNKSYYAFQNKGFRFIVLDANYDRNGVDHFFKKGADWQDTNIPPDQMNWLLDELNNHPDPTVIFCHHPFFSCYKDGYKFHINNYKEIQAAINGSGNVVAVFHGHVHQEIFKRINNVHYIVQLGMVDYEGLENNTFSLIKITDQTLEITGFKRATNKKLEIHV